jgi:hypothetical protein
MVTIIPTTCAPQLVRLAMAVGANHWPKRWPAAALMVGRRRNMLKLLVADAVAVEPVSKSKFPANREINREFLKFEPASGSEHAIRPMN